MISRALLVDLLKSAVFCGTEAVPLLSSCVYLLHHLGPSMYSLSSYLSFHPHP